LLIYSAPLAKWRCVYKKCSAQCCVGGREVTAGDIKRIHGVTNKEPEDFAVLEDEKGLFKLKNRDDGDGCLFLSDDYSCKLHGTEGKPLLCRMYPFKFDGIVYGDEIFLKLKAVEDCPGLGKGEQLGANFEAHLEDVASKFVKELKEYLKLKHEGLEGKKALEAL